MNYVIQRGKVRQQAINVPDGLPELLSDITREVLRCQPTKECLCQFIIDYLHSVIVTREKAMVAKSIIDRALRKVDEIISDLCICDLSKEKTDIMAQVLEDCFRNFLERRRCEMRKGKEIITYENFDILEELLLKCKFTEEEMAMSRPAIESAYKRFVEAYMAAAAGSDGTELLYQYFRDRELKRIEEHTREQAAIVIQAAWRGYLVRSKIPENICTCICMLEDEIDEEALVEDRAARVIQRFFRRTMQRVSEKSKIDPCEEPPSVLTTIDTQLQEERDVEAEEAAAAAIAAEAAAAEAAAEPEATTAEPAEVEIIEAAPAEAEGQAAVEVEEAPAGEEAPPAQEAPAAPEVEEAPVEEAPPAVVPETAPEETPAEVAPAEEAPPAEEGTAEAPPPE